MTMEDKTFMVRLIALAIEVIWGEEAADDFRREAIRDFGAHLYRDDITGEKQ